MERDEIQTLLLHIDTQKTLTDRDITPSGRFYFFEHDGFSKIDLTPARVHFADKKQRYPKDPEVFIDEILAKEDTTGFTTTSTHLFEKLSETGHFEKEEGVIPVKYIRGEREYQYI